MYVPGGNIYSNIVSTENYLPSYYYRFKYIYEYKYFFFFFWSFFVVVVVVIAIFWAAPAAYGGSQARG